MVQNIQIKKDPANLGVKGLAARFEAAAQSEVAAGIAPPRPKNGPVFASPRRFSDQAKLFTSGGAAATAFPSPVKRGSMPEVTGQTKPSPDGDNASGEDVENLTKQVEKLAIPEQAAPALEIELPLAAEAPIVDNVSPPASPIAIVVSPAALPVADGVSPPASPVAIVVSPPGSPVVEALASPVADDAAVQSETPSLESDIEALPIAETEEEVLVAEDPAQEPTDTILGAKSPAIEMDSNAEAEAPAAEVDENDAALDISSAKTDTTMVEAAVAKDAVAKDTEKVKQIGAPAEKDTEMIEAPVTKKSVIEEIKEAAAPVAEVPETDETLDIAVVEGDEVSDGSFDAQQETEDVDAADASSPTSVKSPVASTLTTAASAVASAITSVTHTVEHAVENTLFNHEDKEEVDGDVETRKKEIESEGFSEEASSPVMASSA